MCIKLSLFIGNTFFPRTLLNNIIYKILRALITCTSNYFNNCLTIKINYEFFSVVY